jgi:hypothetical protein
VESRQLRLADLGPLIGVDSGKGTKSKEVKGRSACGKSAALRSL